MKGPAQSQGPIPGPAVRSSSEPSCRLEQSAASGTAPPRLRPRRDKVRPLTAGAPPRSAPEPLGSTPSGRGNLCNPSGTSFDLVCRPMGPHPASADPARLTALGPDHLGQISESDFFRLSVQQRQQTLGESYNLSFRVWNSLAL
ncbi:hypothetical protein NDU88_004960 [Pleurodeles waltl]|uniref:Uncharacterized protein n=1 Tax=Pleurodeles waltl TaxID=8319 RepID=A0AAV7VKL1_PLEWA|nr:hypothetical protein NDU88_004960 [Pleurodeles waltl]